MWERVHKYLRCPLSHVIAYHNEQTLTLASKEATWLRLLLTELGLLLPSNQYTEIRVVEGSTGAAEIKANLRDQEEERQSLA